MLTKAFGEVYLFQAVYFSADNLLKFEKLTIFKLNL